MADDVAVCEACPVGQRPVLPYGDCVAFTAALSHDFGPFSLAVGEEQSGTCESWVLDNDEDVFVSAIEVQSDGGFHHAVLFWVPEDFGGWPADRWVDCYDHGFSEVFAAANGGVLIATSTEVRAELQQLSPKTALKIPPRSRIIAAMHLKNETGKGLTTSLRTRLVTVSTAAVALAPAQLVVPGLEVPTDGPSTFSGTCDVDAAYREFMGEPLAMKVHGFAPHFHPALTGFDVTVVGGPQDGRVLVALGPYEPVTLGHVFDPPIDLAGATGLSVTCSYDPAFATDPSWGNGHEEKCETLVLIESAMAFAGVVTPGAAAAAPSPNGRHDWPCQVVPFPYPPASGE